MPSQSIASPVALPRTLAALPPAKKLLLLLGNAIPLLHGGTFALLALLLRQRAGLCVLLCLVYLYLLPPLLCRLLSVIIPIRQSRIPIGSREFFCWWLCLNLQNLFNRFPALEECLRLVPGCYSLWLRLWGSTIGKLTYWAAGVRVLDRQWLVLGDHVAFGAGVRINPHVILPDADGRLELQLAPVTIEDHVSVGGYSLLVAGTRIAAGQCTRAFTILPPFSRLENGRRNRPESPGVALFTGGR